MTLARYRSKVADKTRAGHGSGDGGDAPEAPSPAAGTDDTLAASIAAPTARNDYTSLVAVAREHYIIGSEIARGGMGRIFTARDRRLGRTVAIKELLVTSGDLRVRFEREARITASLQHPAIVSIMEAGTWPSGEPFYAMKLVSGESLDKVVAGTRTVAERLALLPSVIAVADALAYAHDREVIHRDLKPANVLIGAFGETVVIDWGLAKDLADRGDELDVPVGPYRGAGGGGDGRETVAGAVMGTPAYMPPEQASGEPVDATADVYSLGALLYHVLAGRPPYLGRAADAVLAAVLDAPPAPIREVDGVPADLAAIVDKAMARERADRYPTAGALAVELKRFQTGQLVGAQRYTPWMLVRRWLRRHRAIVGVAAAALALVATLSAIGLWRILAERTNAEHQAVLADAARRASDATTVSLLVEQGRQELLAKRPQQASAYLAEAYLRSAAPSTALRAMLANALAQLEMFRFETGNEHARVAIARSGELVVTFPDHLELRDPATGALASTIAVAGAHALSDVRMLADGRAAVTDGDRLVVVDTTTGRVTPADAQQLAAMPQANGSDPTMLHYNDRGDRAVRVRSGSDTDTIEFVAADGRPTGETAVATDRDLFVVALSPDGATAIVRPKGSNELLAASPVEGARAISTACAACDALFDPTGRLFVVLNVQSVEIHDAHSLLLLASFEVTGRSFLRRAVCSLDGAFLYAVDARGAVHAISLAPWRDTIAVDGLAAIDARGERAVRWTAGGMAIVGPHGDRVPLAVPAALPARIDPAAVAFVGADAVVGILRRDTGDDPATGDLVVWDAHSGRLVQTLATNVPRDAALVGRRDDTAVAYAAASVALWRGSGALAPIDDAALAGLRNAVFADDGRHLAASHRVGTLHVIDVDARTVASFPVPPNPLDSPALRELLVISDGGTIAADSEVADDADYFGKSDRAVLVELSPRRAFDVDEGILAVSDAHRALGEYHVLDTTTGRPLCTLSERLYADAAAFDAAGTLVAVDTSDGTQLVDAITCRILTLPTHVSWFHGRPVHDGGDGRVARWAIPLEQRAAAAVVADVAARSGWRFDGQALVPVGDARAMH